MSLIARSIKRLLRSVGYELKKTADSHQAENINTREYWDSVWSKESLDSREYAALHQAICAIVPEARTVLDVGCGNGRLLRQLKHERRSNVIGLDLSEVFLTPLRLLGVTTVQAQLPSIPFKPNSFDVVVSSETMEHLNDPGSTVHEMHRVAKTGGILLFSVPGGAIWGLGGEHVQCFSAADCHELLRPYVGEVHILALTDSGFPHLICWGETVDNPVKYHPDWYAEANERIALRITQSNAS